MKKVILTMLAVISALSLCFGIAGCGTDLKFENDALTIDVGTNTQIVKIFDGENQIIDFNGVTFSSDNESVLTVDGMGNVTVVSVGLANVTATYNGKKAVLPITVSASKTPVISADGNSFSALYSETIDLGIKLVYGGKTYKDVEFTYSMDNQTMGTAYDSLFTAGIKTGTVNVSVDAVWRGIKVATKIIPVSIQRVGTEDSSEDVLFYIDNDGIKFSTEQCIQIFGKDDLVLSASVADANSGINVSYEDGVLKLGGNGLVGNADVSYGITLEGVDKKVIVSFVYVDCIIDTVDEFVEIFGRKDAIDESFTSYQQLKANSGVYILGADLDFAGVDLGASYKGYFTKYGEKDNNFSVDYVNTLLGAAEGESVPDYYDYYYDSVNYGFNGVLNGLGYTIKNLAIPAGGLFGILNGEVKDIAFIDCTTEDFFIGESIGKKGILNNIFVKSSEEADANKAFVQAVLLDAKLNNLYLETNNYLTFYTSMIETRTVSNNTASYTYTKVNSKAGLSSTGLIIVGETPMVKFKDYGTLAPFDVSNLYTVRYARYFDLAKSYFDASSSIIKDNSYMYINDLGLIKWNGTTEYPTIEAGNEGYYNSNWEKVTEITLHTEYGPSIGKETISLSLYDGNKFSTEKLVAAQENPANGYINIITTTALNGVYSDDNVVYLSMVAVRLDNATQTEFKLNLGNGEGLIASGFNILLKDFAKEDSVVIEGTSVVTTDTDDKGVVVVSYIVNSELIYSKEIKLEVITVESQTPIISATKVYIDDDGLTFEDDQISALFGDNSAEKVLYVDNTNFAVDEGVIKPIPGLKADLDVSYDANISTNHYKIVGIQFVYVTKAIDNAEEFIEVFGRETAIASAYNGYQKLTAKNGVYVITKDIDFAGYTLGEAYEGYIGSYKSTTTENNLQIPASNAYFKAPESEILSDYFDYYYDSANYGLTGVLEGLGHKLSNIDVPKGGIFGIVSGTIKNIVFENYTTEDFFLGEAVSRTGILENVAVFDNQATSNDKAFVKSFEGGSKANNVYMETENFVAFKLDHTPERRSATSYVYNDFDARGGLSSTGFVVIGSQKMFRYQQAGTATAHDLAGVGATESATVKRYATYFDMAKNAYGKGGIIAESELFAVSEYGLVALNSDVDEQGKVVFPEIEAGNEGYYSKTWEKVTGITLHTEYGVELTEETTELYFYDGTTFSTETLVAGQENPSNGYLIITTKTAFTKITVDGVVSEAISTAVNEDETGTLTIGLMNDQGGVSTENVTLTSKSTKITVDGNIVTVSKFVSSSVDVNYKGEFFANLPVSVVVIKPGMVTIDTEFSFYIDDNNNKIKSTDPKVVAMFEGYTQDAFKNIAGKNGGSFEIKNGNIKYVGTSTDVAEYHIALLTDSIYFTNIKITYVTKIITNADEFIEIFRNPVSTSPYDVLLDGYYVIGNDIDLDTASGGVKGIGVFGQQANMKWANVAGLSGRVQARNITSTTQDSYIGGCGLTGTFDGQGYTISNMTLSGLGYSIWCGFGLFGFISGTVKDVTFANVKATLTGGTIYCSYVIALAKTSYAVYENVSYTVDPSNTVFIQEMKATTSK